MALFIFSGVKFTDEEITEILAAVFDINPNFATVLEGVLRYEPDSKD